MNPKKQRRTFISYSRINKDFALQLAKEMKSDGFLVWLDQLDIPTGARWDNELEKALEECGIFLLILTPASIASENVKDEIGYAIDNGKRILPILLENCNVPLRLRRFQYIDFTTMNYDEGVESAKHLLTNLINEATIPRTEIPDVRQNKEEQVEAEEKLSAKETAARIVLRRTASNRYITEQQSVLKASALLMEGKQFLQNEDLQGAAQKFYQVLELIPDHGETKTLLANTEAQIQQAGEAKGLEVEGQHGESQPNTEKILHRSSTPVAPTEILTAENTETEISSETESTQDTSGMVGSFQKRFSRKVIILGAVGLLVALAGIIGATVFLAKGKPASITSAGMVNIPAGSYTINTNTSVDLAEFWIDRYEVTNSDYAKFVDETNENPPGYWVDGEIPVGLKNHPVSKITWDQAKEYCSWAGKRLPTEAEWEVAARGPFGWKYPWGNDPDEVRQETRGTRPVDSNPANRSYFGAYFLSGNVWEWVQDPYTSTAENEHVMRGGAYGPLDILTTAVSITDNSTAIEKAGVRCVASGENVTRKSDEALALDDNFESSNTKWPRIIEDKFLFDYHEFGFYHVEAREPNKFVPAFYDQDTYSNFVLETGVFVDKANTDNQQGNFLYGLGIQTTDDQFYAFVVSANNQNWQVLKGPLDPDTVLSDVSDLTIIKSGQESSIRGASEELEDRLTVIANGAEFSYYVNGNLVHKITIEDRQWVKVGFIVETLDDVTRVHIHYNWLKLQNIEPFDS